MVVHRAGLGAEVLAGVVPGPQPQRVVGGGVAGEARGLVGRERAALADEAGPGTRRQPVDRGGVDRAAVALGQHVQAIGAVTVGGEEAGQVPGPAGLVTGVDLGVDVAAPCGVHHQEVARRRGAGRRRPARRPRPSARAQAAVWRACEVWLSASS